jgi:anti-sigma B factor antagonist
MRRFSLESRAMAIDNLQIEASDGARGIRILRLIGSLNIHSVFGFQELVRKETATLILDFSRVPFIDSAGLGSLVGLHISSKKAMRKVAFAAINTQVKALLEMTNVAQLFPTYATVQEAEVALAGSASASV